MDLMYLVMVLLMKDGTRKAITSEPFVATEGVDTDLICELHAYKTVLKMDDVDKFDFLCVPDPDWSMEDSKEDSLKDIKKDLMDSSS